MISAGGTIRYSDLRHLGQDIEIKAEEQTLNAEAMKW